MVEQLRFSYVTCSECQHPPGIFILTYMCMYVNTLFEKIYAASASAMKASYEVTVSASEK